MPSSPAFTLRYNTSAEWVKTVTENMDQFLPDHASAEKKASGMAMSLVSHYPDRHQLVKIMTDIAIEELAHFRDVIKIMQQRGLIQGADEKDPYINHLRKNFRKDSDLYMMDRLIIGAIVEARGAERFGLIRDALPGHDPLNAPLKVFYQTITQSEERHQDIFIELAYQYLPKHTVDERLDHLLDKEAEIVSSLPIRCALH